MYLTGFQKECILRFAELNLVRGDWRKYNYALSSAGEVTTEKQIDDGVLEHVGVVAGVKCVTIIHGNSCCAWSLPEPTRQPKPAGCNSCYRRA